MRATIIILVIFFIFIFQVPISISVYTNAIKNKGTIVVKLFYFLPIFVQSFRFSAGFIEFFKNPKKIKKIKLDLNPLHIKNMIDKVDIILNCQVIKKVKLKTLIGLKNAFASAMINGGIASIISVFSSINLNNGNILNFESENQPIYDKNNIEIFADLNIKISIMEILFMLFQIRSRKVKV